MMNETIVENIRELAKAHNTTLKKLEVDLGFGNGTIGKWAKAPKTPPYGKLLAIATFFGVSVDRVLGTETKKQPPRGELSEAKREFLDFVDTLSEDQIKKLHQLGLLALDR